MFHLSESASKLETSNQSFYQQQNVFHKDQSWVLTNLQFILIILFFSLTGSNFDLYIDDTIMYCFADSVQLAVENTEW